jgi:hypothetical protein
MPNMNSRKRISTLLATILRENPNTAVHIADLMQEIGEVEEQSELQEIAAHAVNAANAIINPRGRAAKLNTARYELRHIGRGEYELVEKYGKHGFHLSKKLYERLAQRIAAEGNERVPFHTLEKTVKVDPNLIRMAIRFWKIYGLIEATNTPYLALPNFENEAQKLWDELRYGPARNGVQENSIVATDENSASN